jgi:hypothetical protein
MPFQQYAPFFQPEELDTLTAAFDATWQNLKAAGLRKLPRSPGT